MEFQNYLLMLLETLCSIASYFYSFEIPPDTLYLRQLEHALCIIASSQAKLCKWSSRLDSFLNGEHIWSPGLAPFTWSFASSNVRGLHKDQTHLRSSSELIILKYPWYDCENSTYEYREMKMFWEEVVICLFQIVECDCLMMDNIREVSSFGDTNCVLTSQHRLKGNIVERRFI